MRGCARLLQPCRSVCRFGACTRTVHAPVVWPDVIVPPHVSCARAAPKGWHGKFGSVLIPNAAARCRIPPPTPSVVLQRDAALTLAAVHARIVTHTLSQPSIAAQVVPYVIVYSYFMLTAEAGRAVWLEVAARAPILQLQRQQKRLGCAVAVGPAHTPRRRCPCVHRAARCAGYACPAGSANSTAGGVCPIGTFAAGGGGRAHSAAAACSATPLASPT